MTSNSDNVKNINISKRDRSPESDGKSSEKRPRTAMKKSNNIKKIIKNSRTNYWSPLQCLPDNDSDNEMDDEIISPQSATKKVYIPPIKVLQKSSDYVHNLTKSINISDYCIKKISIGIKIQCESIESYKSVNAKLKSENIQFFSHDFKGEKAFKVVLYGISDMDASLLKNELITIGLKCTAVKKITKQCDQYTDTIYLVSLENGSTKLSDLKKNIRSICHTQISWSYQRKLKGKLTQCYNCQMFGHGEKNCHIKTYCAVCAGPHNTDECTNESSPKCANCNGPHKSTDPTCVSRLNYLELKEKSLNQKQNVKPRDLTSRARAAPHITFSKPVSIGSLTEFPSLRVPRQRHETQISSLQRSNEFVNPSPSHQQQDAWENSTGLLNVSTNARNNIPTDVSCNMSTDKNTPLNTLFSAEELNRLAMEMISKLAVCKNKIDQFNVITHLATKFLYNDVK